MSDNMDYLKIQELRAAVLNDLKEFIPKNSYLYIRNDEELFANDCHLAKVIRSSHYINPKLTPRQYSAVNLFEKLGLFAGADGYVPEDPAADLAEGVTIKSIKEAALHSLQAALNRYAEHINPDEARALLKNHACVSVTEPTPGTMTKTSNDEAEESKIENPAWQERARQKANEIYKKEKSTLETDPSNKAIAEEIKKEFEKEGVLSVKGKTLTADYILRHGLEGWERPKI